MGLYKLRVLVHEEFWAFDWELIILSYGESNLK